MRLHVSLPRTVFADCDAVAHGYEFFDPNADADFHTNPDTYSERYTNRTAAADRYSNPHADAHGYEHRLPAANRNTNRRGDQDTDTDADSRDYTDAHLAMLCGRRLYRGTFVCHRLQPVDLAGRLAVAQRSHRLLAASPESSRK